MGYMLFSVVTATRNSEAFIRECTENICAQTLGTEHLIIDSESTDRTLEEIMIGRHGRTRVISEPDDGPYDAMNKGINKATGEVIGILNADDFYADDSVLESVAQVFEDPSVDSCYGDLEYVDRENPKKVVRRWKAGPYDRENWYRGWMPPHPTFFVRKCVYEENGLYRLDMGTAADYELMLRLLLKHDISTVYIPKVLVKMRTGGMSNVSIRNRIKANLMDRRAWKVNGLRPKPWTLWMKPLGKVGQWL